MLLQNQNKYNGNAARTIQSHTPNENGTEARIENDGSVCKIDLMPQSRINMCILWRSHVAHGLHQADRRHANVIHFTKQFSNEFSLIILFRLLHDNSSSYQRIILIKIHLFIVVNSTDSGIKMIKWRNPK